MALIETPSNASDQSRVSRLDVVLFLGIAVWMTWGIGSYGLYEPHEAQYAGGASEMVQRGDWVTPYLDGAPELNKPPLFYWMIAASFKLLGGFGAAPELVARIPLAMIALFGTFLAWNWARELWGRNAAHYAALMLAVSSGWYIFAHQLLIDELLSILMLAALFSLWKAIQDRNSIWRWSMFYILLGLAVLAKGLPGLFFPSMTFLIFIIVRRDWKLIRDARPLLGIVIVAALVAPWAYLFEMHNPGALQYIIVNEHLRRVVDARVPHDYGVVQVSLMEFIVLTLAWGTPWTLMLPQVVQFAARGAASKSASKPSIENDGILLLAISAALPVVFFSLIPSRLIYYGLPAVPPFMVLCAGYWCAPQSWPSKRSWFLPTLTATFGVAIIGATLFLPNWLSVIPDIELPVIQRDIPFSLLLTGIALLSASILLLSKQKHFAFAVLVIFMGLSESMSIREFGAFDSLFSSKRLVEKLSPAAGDDCVWISEGSSEVGASAGIAFYLRQITGNKTATVLILGDDERRPPPHYPGPTPKFLIDHKNLDEIWSSGRPAVFVTDFQRTDWQTDKPRLPSSDCLFVPLSVGGHRHVYVNTCVWNRLAAAGLVPAKNAAGTITSVNPSLNAASELKN